MSAETKLSSTNSLNLSQASASNVTSLRKKFENNFKLSAITTVFKSKPKSKLTASVKKIDKENQLYQLRDAAVTPLSTPHINNLNCKDPNCCCKTFVREYAETPGQKFIQKPKIPLRDCTSDLNRLSSHFAINTTENKHNFIDKENEKQDCSKSRVQKVGYEFYRPKLDSKTNPSHPALAPVPDVAHSLSHSQSKYFFNKLDGTELKTQTKEKVFEFTADKLDESKRSYGFVNFTATSMSEAGYLKHSKPEYKENKSNPNIPVVDENLSNRNKNFSFKYRTSKTNLSVRETAHPYGGKKRLTVKGIKSRNMKHKQKHQQSLGRSNTFSGYDNLAFKQRFNLDETCPREFSQIIVPPPNRMNGYDEHITNNRFAVASKDAQKIDLETNFSNTESGHLKRHCSLGYLAEDEVGDAKYDFSFPRNRMSLGNISNISSKIYALRSFPDVSKKENKSKHDSRTDIDAQALFSAVELGQLSKAKRILELSNLNINRLNADDLSPLDVAVLSNNKSLVKLLISYGAECGRKYSDASAMRDHLYQLLLEAENRVQSLNISASQRYNINLDQISYSEIDYSTKISNSQSKKYRLWDRRVKGLKRLLIGFEGIELPESPYSVKTEVINVNSARVSYSLSTSHSSITTKIIVRWSTASDFNTIAGIREIYDIRKTYVDIEDLHSGKKYFIQVAAGNIKGLSSFRNSSPFSIILSSWREVAEYGHRFDNTMENKFTDISKKLYNNHPYLRTPENLHTGDTEIPPRKQRTTLKQLFTASAKFQKNLKRGVYLSCIIYQQNKILVTNDDFLPTIQIDDNVPSKLATDYYWLLKVSCNWIDIKNLKIELEKYKTSSVDFRIKMINAIAQMQMALNTHDLGHLHHKIIKGPEETNIICLVNRSSNSKSMYSLNLKWLPQSKLDKKSKISSNIVDQILLSSVLDQICFHTACNSVLPRGLYVCYLKINNSVDSLQLVASSKIPNILPHCKIRDNPHVTAEEWTSLTNFIKLRSTQLSPQQKKFIEQFRYAATKLFNRMELPESDFHLQRLYDAEVIEINDDISLILAIPPSESICTVSDSREFPLSNSELSSLPAQVFEMVHFSSYQPRLINLYSRLSCIIEIDIDLAYQELRQAFYSSEISATKKKLSLLEDLLAQLNSAWKNAHWLLDVISYARDRTNFGNISKIMDCSIDSNLYNLSGKIAFANCKSEATVLDCKEVENKQNENSNYQFEIYSSQIIDHPSERNNVFDSSINNDISYTDLAQLGAISSSSNWNSKSCSSSSSTQSNNSYLSQIEMNELEQDISGSLNGTAILQIHAAFPTGSNTQRSFKFHISRRSTAREIVDMFMKQTNMSTLLAGKGGTIYSEKASANFCLVVVSNEIEHVLDENFNPMNLEQPWVNGRLYVRHRSKPWAALKVDSKHPRQSSYV